MKLENVVKVMLAFENCEDIVIPIEEVSYFYVSGITESFRLQNILKKSEATLLRYKGSDYFSITFAEKDEYKRVLEWNDIAQVHLYDKDDNSEWFFVKWGDDEYNNPFQKSKVYQGRIFVTIGEESE